MPEAYTGHDRTAIYLSGGASNHSPAASLGGAISTRAVLGMSPLYTAPVQGVIVEDATPENGEGDATIEIDGDDATYTPPGGTAGSAVTIAEGERKVLFGADATKAIRLYRPVGATFTGTAGFRLVDAMNGVLSMGNVADGTRDAGGTHYRAFFVKALADVVNAKLWLTTDGQATYHLAAEAAVADTIQTISDEETSPVGVSWEAAVSVGTALSLGSLSAGDVYGVWIRRTFPAAGNVATRENVNLHLQHSGV